MKYILSHPRLTISANPLARKLQEITGEEILVYSNPLRVRIGDELIIRYGNSELILGTDCKYNYFEHIRLAGNKVRLSALLMEKEFPHVEFKRGNPEDYPIVSRTEINRGGGIGIKIIQDEEEFENDQEINWWTPWYDFQFELGVHILGGEVAKVFKKVREDGLPEEEFPIRNTHRGYKFSLRTNWKDHYKGVEKFVKKLFEIVPIQFARLDIGFDRDTGGYRLIEINSAPDLSQNSNTLNMYANFLAERIFK